MKLGLKATVVNSVYARLSTFDPFWDLKNIYICIPCLAVKSAYPNCSCSSQTSPMSHILNYDTGIHSNLQQNRLCCLCWHKYSELLALQQGPEWLKWKNYALKNKLNIPGKQFKVSANKQHVSRHWLIEPLCLFFDIYSFKKHLPFRQPYHWHKSTLWLHRGPFVLLLGPFSPPLMCSAYVPKLSGQSEYTINYGAFIVSSVILESHQYSCWIVISFKLTCCN